MADLDIPESWAEAQWEDVFDIQGGGQPPKENFIDSPKPGYVRLLQIRDFESDKYAVYIPESMAPKRCTTNDILIGRYGASVGRVCTGKAGAYNVALAKLIYSKKGFNKLFIESFLRSPSFQRLIISFERAAQAGFNKEDLKDFKVPVPPLAEQKRIVAKIEATSQRIGAIEKAVAEAEVLLSKYRESLLAKAFRGELVPQDPNDEPASKLLERIRAERDKQQNGKKKRGSDLPPISEDEIPFEIPSSWEWVRLGEICSKIGSGQTPRGGSNIYLTAGVPLIRSQNVLNGMLELSDVAYISEQIDEEMSSSRIFEGDVLFNITGGSIGRTCVVPKEFKRGNVNQHVLAIRPALRDEILSEFISCFLLSPFGKEFIFKNKKGAARDAITKSQIDNLIFPLPPFSSIRKIVFQLRTMEWNIVQMKKGCLSLRNADNKLKTAILNSAFSGRLVPQDPSEGTGHEILAEIMSTKNVSSCGKSREKKTRSSEARK
jgi:type I restriction enzyme S subunit